MGRRRGAGDRALASGDKEGGRGRQEAKGEGGTSTPRTSPHGAPRASWGRMPHQERWWCERILPPPTKPGSDHPAREWHRARAACRSCVAAASVAAPTAGRSRGWRRRARHVAATTRGATPPSPPCRCRGGRRQRPQPPPPPPPPRLDLRAERGGSDRRGLAPHPPPPPALSAASFNSGVTTPADATGPTPRTPPPTPALQSPKAERATPDSVAAGCWVQTLPAGARAPGGVTVAALLPSPFIFHSLLRSSARPLFWLEHSTAPRRVGDGSAASAAVGSAAGPAVGGGGVAAAPTRHPHPLPPRTHARGNSGRVPLGARGLPVDRCAPFRHEVPHRSGLWRW